MRKIFMLLVCAVVVAAFVGIGICADSVKSKDSKMSMMDKMKKAYSDFRNRDKAKTVSTAKPVKTALPAAAKKEPLKPKEIPVEPVKKEFTREEMIADIKDDLETYDEIANSLPGIKTEKDAEGKLSYTYNGAKIDDVSKEDLQPLFNKVRQLAVKLRTERIEQQLETVRQVDRLRGVNVPPKPPQSPQAPSVLPSAPGIPSIQRVPAVPNSSRSIPRAQPSSSSPPSVPPVPPRR